MTRIATLLLLLVFGAVEAFAQSGTYPQREINFQGRVRDANGIYLDGTHAVTIKIYTTATGSSSLVFSESHPGVDFKTGLFSIPIGSETTGGIPGDLDFTAQYWLGITIAGFNGGQEIQPRMAFHCAAYSFYSIAAAAADSAGVSANAYRADLADAADSSRIAGVAWSLNVPAKISGTNNSGPAVEIINFGEVGMVAQGGIYGVVSRGTDSTTEHYVAAGTLGNDAAPAPGGLYRDNAPYAWGLIDANGQKLAGFGIDTVIEVRPGYYRVMLSNPAATINLGDSVSIPELTAVTQVTGITYNETYTTANWYFPQKGSVGADRTIIVETGQNGDPSAASFSIVVFGRPAQ